MVLHEEQDPGDGVLPLFRCVPQAGTVDVDMEATGARLMAEVRRMTSGQGISLLW